MRYINNILISRTDSIGDVILTLPLAAYIKQQQPDLHVSFLCKTYTSPIVHLSPFIDRVYLVEEIDQVPSFDAILHVYPSPTIARWAKKRGIPYRIGTSHRLYHWRYCNKLVHFSRKKSILHEAQLNFYLLKPLFNTNIPSLEELKKYMKLIPPTDPLPPYINQTLDPKAFRVILHPKSKGSAREWPLMHFNTLISICKDEPIQFILTGTEEEGKTFRDVLTSGKHNVVDLSGKLTLNQLVKLISEADALVAASTGPLHIAAAIGIHAIGIFPPIHPMHPGRWQPLGPHVHIFVKKTSCNLCKSHDHCTCMEEISPEEVATLLCQLERNKRYSD